MNITDSLQSLWQSTGIANMILPANPLTYRCRANFISIRFSDYDF